MRFVACPATDDWLKKEKAGDERTRPNALSIGRQFGLDCGDDANANRDEKTGDRQGQQKTEGHGKDKEREGDEGVIFERSKEHQTR